MEYLPSSPFSFFLLVHGSYLSPGGGVPFPAWRNRNNRGEKIYMEYPPPLRNSYATKPHTHSSAMIYQPPKPNQTNQHPTQLPPSPLPFRFQKFHVFSLVWGEFWGGGEVFLTFLSSILSSIVLFFLSETIFFLFLFKTYESAVWGCLNGDHGSNLFSFTSWLYHKGGKKAEHR